MSYRLINANDLALKYPEVNDMPCIYADLPKGLDGRYYGLTKRMQRWIPVTERLPEVGHRVIFNMNNDEIYIGTLYKWDNDLKISLEPTGIGYVYSFENVTAWMPLPKPYKAGE